VSENSAVNIATNGRRRRSYSRIKHPCERPRTSDLRASSADDARSPASSRVTLSLC